MSIYDDLSTLRLYYLADHLDEFLGHAKKSSLTAKDLVYKFVELETLEKQRRSTDARLRAARIGKFRQMADFDWNWPGEIPRSTVEELLTSEFIREKQNIIIAGQQGVGKTMIAKNVAWQAALNGNKVLFTTASDMVIDLGSQESTAALQRRIKRYVAPHLLVIDELGYLSIDNRSADIIFDIVSKRYENGSIFITTNLAFKDWGRIFPGAACVSAMVDRLTHHAEILKIEAESYRLNQHKNTKTKKGVTHGRASKKAVHRQHENSSPA